MIYNIATEKRYLSFINFFEDAWSIIEPGVELNLNWHHKIIAGVLQAETYRLLQKDKKDKDIIINIPFRATKSNLVTVLWPVWSWVICPELSFLTASYSEMLSTSHARKSRNLIKSQWFQEHFGHIFQLSGDQNVKKMYENDSMGVRIATSLGGSATGQGGDVIIIDDPQNPKEASSKKERDTANTNYSETFYSRVKDPKTALRVIIMQRLHAEDLTGYLLKKSPDKYFHICIPAEKSIDVTPRSLNKFYKDRLFWKSRFGNEILADYKNALGSYGYSGQLQQRPSPEEGNIIKKEWFGYFVMEDLPQIKDEDGELVPDVTWHFKLDPAYTKDESNDPSAMMAYTIYNNNLYIRDVVSVHKEMPELIKFIPTWCMINGASSSSKIAIEPKASGLSIKQTLRQKISINVVQGSSPTKDKVARASDISPFLEGGKAFLLKGARFVDSFLDQCAAFPNAAHDDEVDCLIMAAGDLKKNKIFVV